METLPRRSGSLQNLHNRPDRPDRTQDRGRLSRPGRLRQMRWKSYFEVPIFSR